MSSSKNLEFEKTGFLNKSNSAFIEQMYLQYINQDPNLPSSWKNYFEEIGEEIDTIVNEINGPSWSPKKNKISIKNVQELSKENSQINELEVVKSNAKNKNKNSNAKISPAIKLIFAYLLLKTIGLLNNFIQIIIKINAINDLIPAKNIGFKPKFTIFITT